MPGREPLIQIAMRSFIFMPRYSLKIANTSFLRDENFEIFLSVELFFAARQSEFNGEKINQWHCNGTFSNFQSATNWMIAAHAAVETRACAPCRRAASCIRRARKTFLLPHVVRYLSASQPACLPAHRRVLLRREGEKLSEVFQLSYAC